MASWLVAAKNIRLLGIENRSIAEQSIVTNKYGFDLDSQLFADYMRNQMEDHLRERGELPLGLSLDVSQHYANLVGAGEVWLDEEGLPQRLLINLEYPQQPDGTRVMAHIKTDLWDYDRQRLYAAADFRATPLGSMVNMLGLPEKKADWQQVGRQASLSLLLVILFVGLGLFVVFQRRSRLVYGSFVAAIIISMIGTPFAQVYQLHAFSQRQSTHQTEIESARAERIASKQYQETLFASDWDPARVALLEADLGPGNHPPFSPPFQAGDADAKPLPTDPCPNDTGTDTDGDGLTDCQEDKVYGTNKLDKDTDKDRLADGAEVFYLGTRPNNPDSDGDRLIDGMEVITGSHQVSDANPHFLDPLHSDSNNDGRLDTLECWKEPTPIVMSYLVSESQRMTTTILGKKGTGPQAGPFAACDADTDADGILDIFDDDNDGDQVKDGIDLSPQSVIGPDTGFSRQSPFAFTIQQAVTYTQVPLFVDFQLRPDDDKHLAYAMNVLDWPGNDTEGQVRRQFDTTFYDALSPQDQPHADANTHYGDLRLIPMLAITIPYENEVPSLPLTTPHAVRHFVKNTWNGKRDAWLNTVITFTQRTTDSTHLVLEPHASRWETATLYDIDPAKNGPCPLGAVVTTFNNSGLIEQDINVGLNELLDAQHFIAFTRTDSPNDPFCMPLGDIPNGPYPHRMIDTDRLASHGIQVRDALPDNNGTGALLAYAPVHVVPDMGGGKAAFSARMMYWPNQEAPWGPSHQVRLAWMVQLLNDDNQNQIIQTYYDKWRLTGLAIREDYGLDVAVAYEDPNLALDPKIPDDLAAVMHNLETTFINPPDADDDGQRTVRVDTIADTIQNAWGITRTRVMTYHYANQDDLLRVPVQQILNDHFINNGQVIRDSIPTLLFAREERYRGANLDMHHDTGKNVMTVGAGSSLIVDISSPHLPIETLGALNWKPYRYDQDQKQWQLYNLAEYWDKLGVDLSNFYKEHATDVYDQNDPHKDTILAGMVLASQSYYMTFAQGANRIIEKQIDQKKFRFSNPTSAGVIKYSKKVGFGGFKTAVGFLAEDFFKELEKEGRRRIISDFLTAGIEPEELTEADFNRPSSLTAKDHFRVLGGVAEEKLTKFKNPWVNRSDVIGTSLTTIGMGFTLVGTFLPDGKASDIVNGIAKGVGIASAVFDIANTFAKIGDAAVELGLKLEQTTMEEVGTLLLEGDLLVEEVPAVAAAIRASLPAVSFMTATEQALGTVTDAAKKAGLVGVVIQGVVAVGMFIAQWALGAFSITDLGFTSALATAIAAIIAATIMFAISLIPVVGQIITLLVALIDSLIFAICQADKDIGKGKVGKEFCKGISGLIIEGVKFLIFGQTQLVGNLTGGKAQYRLEFDNFDVQLQKPELGFVKSNAINVTLDVTNTIELANVPFDMKAMLYAWQYNVDNLDNSDFNYALQSTKSDLDLDYGSMEDEWKPTINKHPTEATIPLSVISAISIPTGINLPSLAMHTSVPANSFPLGQTGINQAPQVYLTESMITPAQECILVPNPALVPTPVIPVCYIRTPDNTTNTPLTDTLKFDIFPDTLSGFYQPHIASAGGFGYTLGWGIHDTGLTFPIMQDFDGDGLRSKHYGGIDPDDSTWDHDGDGLSDAYEIQVLHSNPESKHSDDDELTDDEELFWGTDPNLPDTDGDGLTDDEEVRGWEFVYGVNAAGTAQLKTWVRSNPLRADEDDDQLTDFQEKTFGFNPTVPSSDQVLSFDNRFQEANAPQVLLRFEERAGAISFSDQSVLLNSGICTGATCPKAGLRGRYGNAVDFDGNDDYVSLPADILGENDFTFAAWVNWRGKNDRQWQRIFDIGSDTDHFVMLTPNGDDNNLALHILNQNTKAQSVIVDTKPLTASQWVHVAVTLEGTTGTIWLNGKKRQSKDVNASLQGLTATSAYLGKSRFTGDPYFNGRLDEVVIFDRALTQSEIEGIMVAKYDRDDAVVKPGAVLAYEGTLKNYLTSRTANGLLSMKTADDVFTQQVSPQPFVLTATLSAQQPRVGTLQGTLAVKEGAPAGITTIEQTAGAIISNWREQSHEAQVWLKLEEQTGTPTTYADSSGNVPGHNGTCTNCPTQETGVVGKGALFDGQDDVIEIKNAPLATGLEPRSICAWGRPAGSVTDSGLVSYGHDVAGEAMYISLHKDDDPDSDTLRVGGWGQFDINIEDIWRDNVWTHVCLTYDGTQAQVYVDGSEVRTITTTWNLQWPDQTAYVGSLFNLSNDYWQGDIDEVYFFNRALIAEEVEALGKPVADIDFGFDKPAKIDCFGGGLLATSTCPTKIDNGAHKKGQQFSGQQFLTTDGAADLSHGRFSISFYLQPTHTNDWRGVFGYVGNVGDGGTYSNDPDLLQKQGDTDHIDQGFKQAYPSVFIKNGRHLKFGFGTGGTWVYGNFDTLSPNLQANRQVNLSDGKWHHVLITYDATNRETVLYVDGNRLEAINLQGVNGPAFPYEQDVLNLGRVTQCAEANLISMDIKEIKDPGDHLEIISDFSDSSGRVSNNIYDQTELGKGIQTINTRIGYCDQATWNNTEDDSSSGNDDLDDISFNYYKTDVDTASHGEDYVTFSASNAAPSYPYQGNLDEFRIYKWILTPADVDRLHGGLGLNVHLAFDDAPGTGWPGQEGFLNQAVLGTKDEGTCTPTPTDTCPTSGVPGRRNQAARFDGNDTVTVPVSNVTGGTNSDTFDAYTFAAWIKPEIDAALSMNILSLVVSEGDVPYQLRLDEDGEPQLTGSDVSDFPTNPVTVNKDQWYHVVATGNVNGTTLYVNGEQAQQYSETPQSLTLSSSANFVIGGAANNDNGFQGIIDEVKVFHTALSAEAVKELYLEAPVVQLHFEAGEASQAESAVVNDSDIPAQISYASGLAEETPDFGLSGRVGDGLLLSHSQSGVVLDFNAPHQMKPPITLGGWLRPSAPITTGNQTVFGVYANWQIWIAHNIDTQKFEVYDGDNHLNLVSHNAFSREQWHHVMLVLDGETLQFYINGLPQSSPTAFPFSNEIFKQFSVGAVSNHDPFSNSQKRLNSVQGNVDEVVLFNDALSHFEIQTLYRHQAKWVQEQETTYLTVDADAPQSWLETYSFTQTNYVPLQYQVQGITATDRSAVKMTPERTQTHATAGVALVEIGVKSPGQNAFRWEAAAPCQDARPGVAWCPGFDPLGVITSSAVYSDTAGLFGYGEGSYEIQTRATDWVGHRETPAQTYTLLVDGTPPTGSLDPVSRYGVQPNAIVPNTWYVPLTGDIADPDLSGPTSPSGSGVVSNTIWITLKDTTTGEISAPGRQRAKLGTTGWSINYSFAAFDPSGEYDVHIEAQDQVGNRVNQHIGTIQVDGTGPRVHLNVANLPGNEGIQKLVTETVKVGNQTITHRTIADAQAPLSILQSGFVLTGTVTDLSADKPNPALASGVSEVQVALNPLWAEPDSTMGSPFHNDVPLAGEIVHLPLGDSPAISGTLPTFRNVAVLDTLDVAHCGQQQKASCPIVGVSGAPGHIGLAVNFNKPGQYLAYTLPDGFLPDNQRLANTSWSLWFRPRSLTATMTLFEVGGDGARLTLNSQGKLCLSGTCWTSALALEANKWHHAILTIGETQTQLYLNGATDGWSIEANPASESGTALLIGASSKADQPEQFFGDIDEVRIFKALLSEADRSKIHLGVTPLLHLPLEQQVLLAGTRLNDVSGWNQQAHLRTSSRTKENQSRPGQVGHYAVALDGAHGDAIETTLSQPLTAHSVSLWVKFTDVNIGTQPIVTIGDLPIPDYQLSLIENSLSYSNAQTDHNGTTTFQANMWYHLVGVIDPDGQMRLYVNGQNDFASTVQLGGAPPTLQGDVIQFGTVSDPRDYVPFTGSMDDIRLYPRALSALEVQDLYRAHWQNAKLAHSSTLTTTWAYTIPAGLEGTYQIRLRAQDALAQYSIGHNNGVPINVPIDSLQPRVSVLTTTNTNLGQTEFQVTVQDYHLDEGSLFATCDNLKPPTRTYFDAPWYIDVDSPSLLYEVSLDCTVDPNLLLAEPNTIAFIQVGSIPKVDNTDFNSLTIDEHNLILTTDQSVSWWDITYPTQPQVPSGVQNGRNIYTPTLLPPNGGPMLAQRSKESVYAYFYGNNTVQFETIGDAIGTMRLTNMAGNKVISETSYSGVSFVIRQMAFVSENQYVYASIDGGDQDCIHIFDITTPSKIKEVGTSFACNGVSPFAVGTGDAPYLYAVGGDNDQLVVYDISDPTQPALVPQRNPIDLPHSAWSLIAYESYLYAFLWGDNDQSTTVMVFDISDPEQVLPASNSTTYTINESWGTNVPQPTLLPAKRLILLPNHVIDILNPTQPQALSGVQSAFNSGSGSIAVSAGESHLYRSDGSIWQIAGRENFFACDSAGNCVDRLILDASGRTREAMNTQALPESAPLAKSASLLETPDDARLAWADQPENGETNAMPLSQSQNPEAPTVTLNQTQITGLGYPLHGLIKLSGQIIDRAGVPYHNAVQVTLAGYGDLEAHTDGRTTETFLLDGTEVFTTGNWIAYWHTDPMYPLDGVTIPITVTVTDVDGFTILLTDNLVVDVVAPYEGAATIPQGETSQLAYIRPESLFVPEIEQATFAFPPR
ncbi:MAG: LamG-like jellyroll fold domain-containing protein [Chloroflexota bacterium]